MIDTLVAISATPVQAPGSVLPAGPSGASAYALAVLGGFAGTLDQWLASLVGQTGGPGPSAYAVAVAAGFTGTASEWIASLKGAPGTTLAADLTDVAAAVRDALTAPGAPEALALLNGLDRRLLKTDAAPTTAEIPADTVRVHRHTITGRVSLWVNDAGTLVDLFAPATLT